MSSLCCGTQLAVMTTDSMPRKTAKMYQSCESIVDAPNHHLPPNPQRRMPHPSKRKMYQSCEALNANTELYPLPYVETEWNGYHDNPFLVRDREHYIHNNNNNNYKKPHPQPKKERNLTLSNGVHGDHQNGHSYYGNRPQFRTYVSVDMETGDLRNGPIDPGKIFNSSSVPCLLDYPDTAAVNVNRKKTSAGFREGGRAYAVSGVPPSRPRRFTHTPPTASQVCSKYVVFACKAVPVK